jgi:hypothetical protein
LKIYKLVYCNNRQLAVAASEFVIAKLFGRAMPGSEGEFTHNQQLIKDLVAFYKDGKVHQHPSYLVDSFIDNCPILKDWPTMVHILLSNESTLSLSYIYILSISILQLTTHKIF